MPWGAAATALPVMPSEAQPRPTGRVVRSRTPVRLPPVPAATNTGGRLIRCIRRKPPATASAAMRQRARRKMTGLVPASAMYRSRRPARVATSAQKPSAAVRNTGVSTDGRSYQNDYLHSQVSGDCVACHAVKSATKTDWTGGNYSHSPVPGTCTTCHAVTKPAAGRDVFRSFAAWPRRLQELSRLCGTKVDRSLGDSIGRDPDAAERKKLGQYHRRPSGHRCGKGRPELRDLPRHKYSGKNHCLRSRIPGEWSQMRLLPLHRTDGNLGHREDQESRKHQQYEGLHGVRLSPAEVLPDLENHKPDVYGRGVG